MKALCWHGTGDVRVDTVPDPTIEDPRDVVIKITTTAICGSDLHLFNGFQPTMEKGDILGHENMGEVVAVGSGISNLKIGDRVVVPFTICCGECFFCAKGLFSCCDRTNPNAEMARAAMGQSPAGLFGFSHMMGGYAGGQAEYLRVPFADVAPIKIPERHPGREGAVPVRHLSDRLHGGGELRDRARRHGGGVGLRTGRPIRDAERLDARRRRVIAIDRVPERLRMAAERKPAETINFDDVKVYDRLMEMTNGRGPDRCIDAVGAEAHGSGSFDAVVDKAKAAVMLGTDRPHVLREAIMCCRKAGTISVPGVYIGLLDKIPFGAAMNKGLTLRMGQTHVPRYTEAAAREDRVRRDRPVVRHHPSLAAGGGPGGLQDVPRQAGRLHQGGPEAIAPEPVGRREASDQLP